jgi:hypothetical protein
MDKIRVRVDREYTRQRERKETSEKTKGKEF